ncbi:hypothetical protein P4571_15375 [Niallia alba]|uniref:hypothetical protein n=1 Tax=Niallia alba TaxID=2729105 RepID=UPI002E23945B|nr:hypothetical protein [Niallia alba]
MRYIKRENEPYENNFVNELLNRIAHQYNKEIFNTMKKLVEPGKNYEDRMANFYDWCKERDIQPLKY